MQKRPALSGRFLFLNLTSRAFPQRMQTFFQQSFAEKTKLTVSLRESFGLL